MNLLTSLLVLNNISTWMLLGSISYRLSQSFSIETWNWLGKSKLSSHKNRNTNLISSNVGIRGYDTSSSIVNPLAHHFHPKHTFLLFEELPNTSLLLIRIFWGHRRVHETVDSFLELDPLLSGDPQLSSFSSLILVRITCSLISILVQQSVF